MMQMNGVMGVDLADPMGNITDLIRRRFRTTKHQKATGKGKFRDRAKQRARATAQRATRARAR
jgi:hypothetical protein